MNLQEIFDQLSYGELAQVYVGSGDAGLINAEDHQKIGASVYLGLTELHKRFLIREAKVIVTLQEGIYTYILDSQLIPDDDVMKIERIYDVEGNELSLNVIDDPCSIRTPTMKSLIVPSELDTESLEVVYRANHPAFDKSQVAGDPSSVEVDLPISYLEPLLFYVASRVLNPVGMVSEFHEGNNYTAKFEAACARLEQTNTRVDTQGTNHRLEMNGWV